MKRLLWFVVLVFSYSICFAQNGKELVGNVIVYNGNKFEYPGSPQVRLDTIKIADPQTGKEMIKVSELVPMPIKMNGLKIYWEDSIENFEDMHYNNAGFNAENIREYLLANLMDELKLLPDGEFYFNIFNVVIDTNGRIAYFEFEGIKDYNMWRTYGSKRYQVDSLLQQKIISKVNALLNNATAHRPCRVGDEPVPCLITKYEAFYESGIFAKDHKIVRL
jgi:hypothetical protein